MTSKANFRN